MHATCVAIGGRAVLLTGPSGAGKSDLALRLIDRGAVLVSDDQVELKIEEGRLTAFAPQAIAGKMEVRGIGIVAMDHASPMPVALLIELAALPERLPEPGFADVCGMAIPCFALSPLEASAPVKVELALEREGLPV